MNDSLQHQLMLASVRTMISEVGIRLGSDNPWSGIDFSEYSLDDLTSAKKLLHEVLYAPPSRA